jgi:hypothetical protein
MVNERLTALAPLVIATPDLFPGEAIQELMSGLDRHGRFAASR